MVIQLIHGFGLDQIPLSHLINNPLTLLHIPQIGRQARILTLAGAVIFDQLFKRRQLGSQLDGIIHGSRCNVFFFNNSFFAGPVGIRYRNIEFIVLVISSFRHEGSIFSVHFTGRQQYSRNINLHIVLDAGLQQAVYIYKVVVLFFNGRFARRIGRRFGVFALAQE